MDFCGTIVSLGATVPADLKLQVGTEVCGALGVKQLLFGAGTLAEYVVVPAEQVALKPARLTAAQSVGLGIAGQTAVLILREAGEVKGKRVLVNGASGGVGTMVLQMLKAKGARSVTGICSAANEAVVRGLGADEVSFKLN
jgi:NADPH:quinone reductase-like Zn-dependent oxidoreductase